MSLRCWLACVASALLLLPAAGCGWHAYGVHSAAAMAACGPNCVGCNTCDAGPGHAGLRPWGGPLACLLSPLRALGHCRSGCGEVYWHDWINEPPVCDSCDALAGCRHSRAPHARWFGLGALAAHCKDVLHQPYVCGSCGGTAPYCDCLGTGWHSRGGAIAPSAGPACSSCAGGGCQACQADPLPPGAVQAVPVVGSGLGPSRPTAQAVRHAHGRPPHPVVAKHLP